MPLAHILRSSLTSKCFTFWSVHLSSWSFSAELSTGYVSSCNPQEFPARKMGVEIAFMKKCLFLVFKLDLVTTWKSDESLAAISLSTNPSWGREQTMDRSSPYTGIRVVDILWCGRLERDTHWVGWKRDLIRLIPFVQNGMRIYACDVLWVVQLD